MVADCVLQLVSETVLARVELCGVFFELLAPVAEIVEQRESDGVADTLIAVIVREFLDKPIILNWPSSRKKKTNMQHPVI